MDAERWRRVQALFDDALEQSPDARAAWLAEACGGDTALRDEVVSLIEADTTGSPVLSRFDRLADAHRERREATVGEVVGGYRLVRALGAGGMGVVFLARREGGYGEPLALKLVQADGDRDELVRRLAREAEVLAILDHPSIARLVETGVTADGDSYLAMEYVDGETISDYCHARELSTPQRVELMIAACDVVAYAHDRGVVHRDLKPAHVLVRRDGTIAILDFGIAKIISDGAASGLFTRPGLRLFTPGYAAPEQILGTGVGPATDVYSLGVIAYELVTGRRPFAGEDLGARLVARLQAGSLPPRPSEVSPDVRGLDDVLLRALEPKPEQRYSSVRAFQEALAAVRR